MFEFRKKYTVELFINHECKYRTTTNNLVAAFNVFNNLYIQKILEKDDSTEILMTVDKN